MKDRFAYTIRKKVLSYIKENRLLAKGDTVIIGLSGGADSVCLFDVLYSLKEEIGITIRALHVHHGIRSVTADKDAEFAKNLCAQADVDIEIVYIDVPLIAKKESKTLEECARDERYKALRREADKYEKAKIAVAHHIEDQAETILFRMVRGTGIKGLAGIRPANGNIVRPLLCLDKEEILKYLADRELDYCTDETNYDEAYARNNIRINVMPKLKAISGEASLHIAALANEAEQVEEFVEEYSREVYKRSIGEEFGGIKTEVLAREKEIIAKNVIRMYIGDSIASLKDITREHVNAVYDLCHKNGYKEVFLPKGYMASTQKGYLVIEKNDKKEREETDIAISFPCSVNMPDGRIMKCEKVKKIEGDNIPQSLYTKWLDYDRISPDVRLRFPRKGDYLVIDAQGLQKSLSRYLIDEKIPKPLRQNVLVLATGSHVHWVVGHRISEDVKITDITEYIAKIQITEGDCKNE